MSKNWYLSEERICLLEGDIFEECLEIDSEGFYMPNAAYFLSKVIVYGFEAGYVLLVFYRILILRGY